MTGFDMALMGLVFISALFGVVRGLTRECLGLVSWASAIFLAYVTAPFAKQFARSYITNPALADATTLFATFLIFLIILSLVSHLLSNLVRNSMLGGLDRSLGFAFGIMRGLALVFILELVVNIFLPRQDYPQMLQQSRFFPFITKGANTLYQILPSNVKNMVDEQKGKRVDNLGKPAPTIIPQSGGRITAIENIQKAQTVIENAAQKAQNLAELRPRMSDQKANSDSPEKAKRYSKSQENSLERLLEQTEDN